MSDKKQCPKCKVLQPLERYTEGRIQCNICLEQKQRYREKHREELREKAKTYYYGYKERRREINKEYNKQMVECSVCKMSLLKCNMNRHEQTGTHLHNLNHPTISLTYKQQHEQKQKQQEQQLRPPKDNKIPQRKLSHIPL